MELNLPVTLDLAAVQHNMLMAMMEYERVDHSSSIYGHGAKDCFYNYNVAKDSPLYRVTLEQWQQAERELGLRIRQSHSLLVTSLLEVELLLSLLTGLKLNSRVVSGLFQPQQQVWDEANHLRRHIIKVVYGYGE